MFTDEDRKMLREAHEAAMWSKKRIGGSTKNGDTLTAQLTKALASIHAGVDWLKNRLGGSVKNTPTVADVLRDLRKS